jgi:hypothetical protein
MKAILRVVSALVVLGLLFLPDTLAAQGLATPQLAPTTVVHGTGNPLLDVPAVQYAVDQGGTVLLKGTFDFGTDAGNHIVVPGRPYPAQDVKGKSTVFIYQKDVRILGETDKYGRLLTVVKNGMPPFWIGWDGYIYRTQPPGVEGVDFGTELFQVDQSGLINYRDTGPEAGYLGPQVRYASAYQSVSATIKHIYFESPWHYGVKATAGRDVILIGNVFHKVQFSLVNANGVAVTNIAAGFIGVSLFYAPFVFPAITGTMDIEQNVVDDSGTNPNLNTRNGECFGFGAFATLATVTFKQNLIRNIGRQANGATSNTIYCAGIWFGDNYAASPLVAQNVIYNTSAFGIWHLAAFPPYPAPRIEKNTVVDSAWSGIQTDIVDVGVLDDVSIAGNVIFQDGKQGKGLSGITANNLNACAISGNSFVGGFAAPLVTFANTTNCKALMNWDWRRPIPPDAPTYFLDSSTSGNLIKGLSGTAVDNGTNNTILLPGYKK